MSDLESRAADQLEPWLAPEKWSAVAARDAVLVLDIEARSDEVARRLARRTTGGLPLLLREVVSVSCFSLHLAGDADWCLESFHRDDMSEAQILAAVDEIVGRTSRADGALVTFNGLEHDLPLLRSRQLRWWQCHHAGLLSYIDGQLPHIDVMRSLARGGTRFTRLVDACASLGVSLAGPTRLEADREVPYETEKGELDVVGTAILYFFLIADRTADRQMLAGHLQKLGCYLRKQARCRPYLRGVAASSIFSLPEQLAISRVEDEQARDERCRAIKNTREHKRKEAEPAFMLSSAIRPHARNPKRLR